MSTASSTTKLLTALQKGKTFTVAQAAARFQMANVRARVDELRKSGHPIVTDLIPNRRTGRQVASYRYLTKLAKTRKVA